MNLYFIRLMCISFKYQNSKEFLDCHDSASSSVSSYKTKNKRDWDFSGCYLFMRKKQCRIYIFLKAITSTWSLRSLLNFFLLFNKTLMPYIHFDGMHAMLKEWNFIIIGDLLCMSCIACSHYFHYILFASSKLN